MSVMISSYIMWFSRPLYSVLGWFILLINMIKLHTTVLLSEYNREKADLAKKLIWRERYIWSAEGVGVKL